MGAPLATALTGARPLPHAGLIRYRGAIDIPL
jgi:hypothetical protein